MDASWRNDYFGFNRSIMSNVTSAVVVLPVLAVLLFNGTGVAHPFLWYQDVRLNNTAVKVAANTVWRLIL